MIRGLIFIVVVLGLGVGFAWLADRPGEMLINWQGQQIELSLMTAVSAIVALIASVMFIWWLLRVILTSPEIMSKYFKTRKRDRGYKALSQGLIAAGAGDAILAKKLTKQSKNLLDSESEPLINLLDVQTAMIDGRDNDARASLQKMADTPETAIIGLRGLYLEAKRLGAGEAARQYAIKAADRAPHLAWASDAAIEYSAQDGDWDDAIRRLEKQRTSGIISAEDAKRKKAVLLTGRALTRSEGELSERSKDALSALSLAPEFVPAATIAAKALFRLGKLRRGSNILEKIWKVKPHPQVAEIYVNARVGDTAGDRLKRAQRLETLKGNQVESLFIVAKIALETRDYSLARQKIESAARLDPRESMYLLLADIEEAETGDQGRVRHWLSCAVNAQRDPKWTTDGYVSDKWAPFSPVTGKLDSFEWRVPLTALTGPITEGEIQDNCFDQAASQLPAIAILSADIPTDEPAIEEPPVDEPLVSDSDIEIVANEPEPVANEMEVPSDEPVIITETNNEVSAPVAVTDEQTTAPDDDKPLEEVDNIVEPEATTDDTTAIASDDKPDDSKEAAEELTDRRFDDPGVDENIVEEKKKSRFNLF